MKFMNIIIKTVAKDLNDYFYSIEKGLKFISISSVSYFIRSLFFYFMLCCFCLFFCIVAKIDYIELINYFFKSIKYTIEYFKPTIEYAADKKLSDFFNWDSALKLFFILVLIGIFLKKLSVLFIPRILIGRLLDIGLDIKSSIWISFLLFTKNIYIVVLGYSQIIKVDYIIPVYITITIPIWILLILAKSDPNSNKYYTLDPV